MKSVSDLTDDEIVDWFVRQGMNGIEITPLLWVKLGNELGVRTNDMPDESQDVIETQIGFRVAELLDAKGKLVDVADGWICATFAEWGKRLANRPADEIAKMLAGAG